jgi:O-antigen/teichoic acid export membrane protein
MIHIKSVTIYAIANACIALVGIMLTIFLGKKIGVAGYGEFASFIAFQNIWAALGFIRLETRVATSLSKFESTKIVLAGFFLGIVISLLLAITCLFFFGVTNNFWLVFISGFAMAVFDSLALRHAYLGQQKQVIFIRLIRIVSPLFFGLILFEFFHSVNLVILFQTVIIFMLALLFWRRWIAIGRWFILTRATFLKHRQGLVPSLFFCLFNAIWLNGLVPYLNIFASPATAGQFAMLQRIVGGSLGLAGTATSMLFARSDYVFAGLNATKKIFLINLGLSFIFCTVLALPILGGVADNFLGAGWEFQVDFYIAMCIFLIFSYSVGAISMLATRLRDEWFQTIWQCIALLVWATILWQIPNQVGLNIALIVGAGMYIALSYRWYFIMTNRKI